MLDPAAALAAAGASDVEPVPVALRHGNGQHAEHPTEHAVTELERLVELRSRELSAYQSPRLAREYREFVARDRGRRAGRDPRRVGRRRGRRPQPVQAHGLQGRVRGRASHPRPCAGRIAARRSSPTAAACTTGCTRPPSGRWGCAASSRWVGGHAARSACCAPCAACAARRSTRSATPRVRRAERALVPEYRALVEKALVGLSLDTYDRAVQLAELPDVVRGYEEIKLRNVDAYHEQVRALGF